MNREIKFRAWDKMRHEIIFPLSDEGHFVDGVVSASTTYEHVSYDMPLMQYTGLKDKNGVEIYEGDIVGYRDDSIGMVKGYYIKYKVVYGLGAFTFEPLDLGDESEFCTLPVEVIGNIYENPELLETV